MGVSVLGRCGQKALWAPPAHLPWASLAPFHLLPREASKPRG